MTNRNQAECSRTKRKSGSLTADSGLHGFKKVTGFSWLGFASISFVLGISPASQTLGQVTRSPSPVRPLGQAPGLESFAVQPETPEELIKAIDYLVRVGLENQAIPLANKLGAIEADDETLDFLRQTIGSSKLLTLQSTGDSNLNAAMTRFVEKLNAASRKVAQDPERIRRLMELLSATPEERDIAIEKLARLGSTTIDEFVQELSAPDLTPLRKSELQYALNRMQRSAVPGLVGALRHPDASVRAAVLEALGHIGDPRALPWAVFEAYRPGGTAEAANVVVSLNDGRPIDDPVRYLISEAVKYLDSDVYFGDPMVEAWVWDDRDKLIKPLTMPANSARGAIGYRLANMAMDIDPESEAAHALIVSMLLDEESRRLGDSFPEQDPIGAWPMTLSAGPRTLGHVLKRAMLTGRHENVAILATRALGQTIKESDLVTRNGRPHILVEALDSPNRRVQFEAAQALLNLAPSSPFPGSSRVVPAMARFLRSNPYAPRAVVINDNVGVGSEWVSHLKSMGYDSVLETSSSDAFEEIAIRGDVELILLSTFLDPAGWALHETVANLKADSRTAGIPVIVVGPLDARSRLSTLLKNGHKIGFMIDPADENWARRQIESQLARLPREGLSAEERQKFAGEAVKALGKTAAAGDTSIFSHAIRSLDALVLNRLQSSDQKAEELLSESNQSELLGTILQDSAPEGDRIEAAEMFADAMRKARFFVGSHDRDRLYELFLELENGKNHELSTAIGKLIGMTEPGASEISRFFDRFAPGANFYESIRQQAAPAETP